MVQGKATEYYLTEKGTSFISNDPKYRPEEKEIIDILKEGRLSVREIQNKLNESMGDEMKRGWGYIHEKLEGLEREGWVSVYSQGKEDSCK